MFEKVQAKMPNVDTKIKTKKEKQKQKYKNQTVTRLTIKLIYVMVESH